MKGLPLLLLLMIALFSACSSGAGAQSDRQLEAEKPTTVIYLTRHAEKDERTGEDPPLLPAGESRAENLAERLAGENISAIYATPYRRTQSTARPLADALSLPITEYAATGDAHQLVMNWERQHTGQTILIVGHSNTIPGLLNDLVGRNQYSDLAEDEYSLLYRVSIDDNGVASVEELHTSN